MLTLGLGNVDQPAEYLAHAGLECEVLGTAGDGYDEVWGLEMPVLGHEVVEGLRVRVTRQPDVLGERKQENKYSRRQIEIAGNNTGIAFSSLLYSLTQQPGEERKGDDEILVSSSESLLSFP